LIDWFWPTGSVAGDRAVIIAGHGWNVSGPSPGGWTQLDLQSGTNWNGAAYTKLLSSTDISNGFVRMFFGGSYAGAVGGVVFVGATGGIRTDNASRNGSGSTSRTVTTDSTPQAGDYAIAFGSARINAVASCNLASQLDAKQQNNGSFVLNGGVLASGGAQSSTFSYGGGSIGDYQAIAVIAP
jgi:hypothetical protein